MVLVTDGSLGIGKGSLRHSLQTLKHRADDKKFPLPFPFPTKLFIMAVANAEEVLTESTIHFYLLASEDGLCKTIEDFFNSTFIYAGNLIETWGLILYSRAVQTFWNGGQIRVP